MNIKLTNINAQLPKRANPTDAGADLFSPIGTIINPNQNKFIDLGIQIELPKDSVGFIFARSGLGSKNGIRPRNCVGVIDEKYRGNLGMMVENSSPSPFEINIGDRIAQLVICPILTPNFEEVDELDLTDDRSGGFGSTGIN